MKYFPHTWITQEHIEKKQELSAFCWGRITWFHSTELSLKYLIMKSRRYRNLEVCAHFEYEFLFAISSCFSPHNALLSLSLSPSILTPPSSLHPTLLHSFHCPAHVLNLPDENRSHCSTTIEWLMQERWTLMDFFFNVLKIEYKAWPPDVVDPFQQQRYCL